MTKVSGVRSAEEERKAPGTASAGTANEDSVVVSVRNLHRTFKSKDRQVHAVNDVSLEVRHGEFLVLLGPSGCGKTTLLRMIAGLEHPDSGHIQIENRTVYSGAEQINISPEKRKLSMVFQSYALWPHMTILDNVAYPLLYGTRGRGHRARGREVAQTKLRLMGIEHLARQYPNQLSGGQQQRVALARALVTSANLVLFDEPLSNVDAKVRERLRLELVTLQKEVNFSAIYVTHDQVEAMEMAARVAVMREGQVVQTGTPRAIYEAPRSRYVSEFIGSSNSVIGKVTSLHGDSMVTVDSEIGALSGVPGTESMSVGDEIVAVWRPERTEFCGAGASPVNRFTGKLKKTTFLGSHSEHLVDVNDQLIKIWTPDPRSIDAETVQVSVPTDCVRILRA